MKNGREQIEKKKCVQSRDHRPHRHTLTNTYSQTHTDADKTHREILEERSSQHIHVVCACVQILIEKKKKIKKLNIAE